MSDQATRLATALSDSYRTDREFGAGGMATIFLARDLRHNRNVALKVLNPELGALPAWSGSWPRSRSQRTCSTRTCYPCSIRARRTDSGSELMPRLSPDGKWLAYQSNECGRFEVYVRPFPAPGARVEVSEGGGAEPIRDRSGRSLYCRGSQGEVVEVGVTTGTGFSIGERKVVLPGDYLTDSSHPNDDVSPDGRFPMLRRAGAESQTIVVHNWGRELREKTAPRRWCT